MPETLTSRERAILIGVAAVCAASRFLALARSLWDWDEALFVLGLRDYDITLHHPHPPGFPVYIAAAKLLQLAGVPDFRALQAINVLAGMLVFPAVYLFARQLRFRFTLSVIAGALFAFLPNVWFFGGGAFSDVPSIVLVLFAVTMLLRSAAPHPALRATLSPQAGRGETEDVEGRDAGVILSRADGEGPSTAQQGRSFGVYAPQDDTRARNTYFLGTFLLALAIGIRPQNFLVGFVPGVFATRKRRPHEILIALLIGITVVGSAFGGAIYATGSAENYLRAVREHRAYITNVDSFRSPERPPMLRLADRFFVKQYQSPALSIIASLLAILAISGSIRDRSRPMLLAALTFVPFAFFAWAMLDRFSISRFSIGYQPLFALLVADGICRAAKKYAPVVAAVLCIAFIAYTLPSLAVVRNEEAPSMRAARAIAQHVDPQRDRLYVGHTMTRFVDVVSPQLPYTRVIDDRDLPLATNKPAWLLAEITEGAENGLLFKRKRDNLWNIARRHYFEIKLAPVTATAQFVGGWSEVESNNAEEWRWMGNHSTTMLPPGGERTLLRVELAPAGEIEAQHPTVTLTLNGKVVDQFQVNPGANLRDLRVSAAAGNQLNMLEIAVDTNVSRALRILHLGWGPA